MAGPRAWGGARPGGAVARWRWWRPRVWTSYAWALLAPGVWQRPSRRASFEQVGASGVGARGSLGLGTSGRPTPAGCAREGFLCVEGCIPQSSWARSEGTVEAERGGSGPAGVGPGGRRTLLLGPCVPVSTAVTAARRRLRVGCPRTGQEPHGAIDRPPWKCGWFALRCGVSLLHKIYVGFGRFSTQEKRK